METSTLKYTKLLALVLFAAFSFNASAASITINTEDLSEEQIAQITSTVKKAKEQASEVAEAAAKATTGTTEKIKQTADTINSIDVSNWGEKGAQFGDAVVNFTSKVGVAAKDLLTSKTGFLIILGLIMYYVGPTIFGFTIMFIWMYVATRAAFRIFSVKERVVKKEKVDKEGNVTKKWGDEYTLHFQDSRGDGSSTFALWATVILFNIPPVLYVIH